MTLENRLFGLGRKTIIPIILAGSLALMGCNSPRHQNPVQNQEPGTTVVENFGEGLSGNVEYTVCGLDSNSYVKYIDTWENGAGFKRHQNTTAVNPYCDIFEVPIIEGANTLEAQAVDNQNLADSTPFVNEFYSPTEEEARAVIDNLLIQRGYPQGPQNPAIPYFEKDSLFYVDSTPITPDYAVKDESGVVKVFLNLGYEDRQNAIDDMDEISRTAIPQNTYIGLPTDEVILRLNTFLDSEGL
jgi:hypothetical protein